MDEEEKAVVGDMREDEDEDMKWLSPRKKDGRQEGERKEGRKERRKEGRKRVEGFTCERGWGRGRVGGRGRRVGSGNNGDTPRPFPKSFIKFRRKWKEIQRK